MSIRIRFLGGSQEVGRSAFLIDSGDKILLDYGVKLTPKGTNYPLSINTNLDAAIISHAHLDHSGNLPHLFAAGKFLSYMTAPTLELAKMLWHDTLHIAGMEGIDATFTRQEILRTERFTFAVNYRRLLDITDTVSLQFFDAGHILGSAMTKLDIGEKSLVYTGDFKDEETRLHNAADLTKIKKCDYLIMESTYGDRDHPPRKELEKKFVNDVQDVIDRGGHALITAFAVGRSQEIADVLSEDGVEADIYLDGMCQKAAKIYLRNPSFLKKPKFLKKALTKINWVRNVQMRKAALKKPSVIITTSGMLQGGPVYFYLPELYNDKNSKLFLTGYQVAETPGRVLLDTGKINLNGILAELKMQYEKYDFSAHAGKKELLSVAKKLSPEKIFLVHGDESVVKKFKVELKHEGFDVYAPSVDEEISL
jgi:putative mRNA 3-end processing factor